MLRTLLTTLARVASSKIFAKGGFVPCWQPFSGATFTQEVISIKTFDRQLHSRSWTDLVTKTATAAHPAAAAPAAPARALDLPSSTTFGGTARRLFQLSFMRHVSGPVPRFRGGKQKSYSSYKERFKTTGTGKIRYMRPGHVHKRCKKSSRHNAQLAKTQLVQPAYAKIMRKIGFKMRSF
jgi:ribosomal protein L35